MALKGIQQFMLRGELGSMEKARETLRLVRQAGYEGLELNGFMIKKMPLAVRALTRMAGMPMGKSGHLDWRALMAESGLAVVSVHEDLGSIERDPQGIVDEAGDFGTETVVVTGMHRFDYSDRAAVQQLAQRLNQAGRRLAQGGVRLLYHNHNCELRKVQPGQTAFALLLEETDPACVNFEFDAYWPAEAGADVQRLMAALGGRLKLLHLSDRGTRLSGPAGSILKSDSMELGCGNMDLVGLVAAAKALGAQAVVLEQHKNWAEKSAVKSLQLSAEFMNTHV